MKRDTTPYFPFTYSLYLTIERRNSVNENFQRGELQSASALLRGLCFTVTQIQGYLLCTFGLRLANCL